MRIRRKFSFTIESWRKMDCPKPETGELGGDLYVKINDWTASLNFDSYSKTMREHIYVSAYPLSMWIAYSWWRLNYEPYPFSPFTSELPYSWRSAHEMTAAGDGFVWPPLRFAFDGERILSFMEYRGSVSSPSFAQFIGGGGGYVSQDDFQRELGNFVEAALARLDNTGIRDTELHVLWNDVKREQGDPAQKAYRILEASLGFDPDEGPEELIDKLADMAETAGFDAIREIASGCSVESSPATLDSLNNIFKLNGNGLTAKYNCTDFVPESISPTMDRPWDAGRQLARALRRHLVLGDSPVTNNCLSDLFQLRNADIESGRGQRVPLRNMSLCVPDDQSNEKLTVYFHLPSETGRRFYLSRLLGDRLINLANPCAWSPATFGKTWRQKFQRAFAAEFLCPIEVLKDKLGTAGIDSDDAFQSIAQEYGLSPQQLTRHFDVNCVPRWKMVSEFSEYVD